MQAETTTLYPLTDICPACGTSHVPTPRSGNHTPPLCRRCDAPLSGAEPRQ